MDNGNINDLDMTVSTLFALAPIIVFSMPFIWLYYRLSGRAYEPYEDDEDIEPEEILKRCFARGEIGCFEYTERMARL